MRLSFLHGFLALVSENNSSEASHSQRVLENYDFCSRCFVEAEWYQDELEAIEPSRGTGVYLGHGGRIDNNY
jgi:hypothetical protein